MLILTMSTPHLGSKFRAPPPIARLVGWDSLNFVVWVPGLRGPALPGEASHAEGAGDSYPWDGGPRRLGTTLRRCRGASVAGVRATGDDLPGRLVDLGLGDLG